MGFKIAENKMLEINKLLKRADKAINVLQRSCNNKIIYPELQKDLQIMIEELDTRYLLSEFEDDMSRNKLLDKIKDAADEDWNMKKDGNGKR